MDLVVGESNQTSRVSRTSHIAGARLAQSKNFRGQAIQALNVRSEAALARKAAGSPKKQISTLSSMETWEILDGHNIGYVNLGIFAESEIPGAMEAMKDTKAIIFDLRGYPDFLLYTLCPYLNPEPTPFVKFTDPNLKQPGLFNWTELFYCSTEANPDYYKGKVIILVDEFTLSRAEFTAMALQTAPNSTVIGSQTAGADGDVSFFYLPGGIGTCFSGIGVYYPDGSHTQRVGIVPDIEVRPTITGIRAGSDEVLLRAINFVENQ